MPVAAVPDYLNNAYQGNFQSASPALRFGMLLPLWGINRRTHELLWSTSDIDYEVRGRDHQEREVKKENKESALRQAAQLNNADISAMHALAARQQRLAASPAFSAHMLTLCATATAPFTTGLGNEHPLENGFAFLTPYGLPYLAGSGVKGVLRQAARELARGEWGDTHGWNDEKINILFGHEAGDEGLVRGALDFWDVIPQIKGDALAVEVMTPHQGHYYQPQPKKPEDKEDKNAGKSISPHDSGQPKPIAFLTVPPESRMNFYVRCDEARLKNIAPELAEGEKWKTLLTAAFEHAFEWLGFGAKTAVGYGAMQTEAQRQRRIEEEKQRQQQRKEQEKAEAARQAEANAETWEGARFKFNRGNGMFSAEKSGQTAYASGDDGKQCFDSLPADLQRKIQTGQFVKGTARIARLSKEIKLLAVSP